MNNEKTKIESVKTLEKQEDQEIPQSVESADELRQKIMSESQQETDSFKEESEGNLVQIETKENQEGLSIDVEDKEVLIGLSKEADAAQKEIVAELDSENKQQKISLEQAEKTKVCQNCGAVIMTGNKFCGECGNKIEKEQKRYENKSEMKERAIENPELLDKKDASKRFLSEERAKLAQELWAERKAQREKLSTLKINIENALEAQESIYGQQEDTQYGKIVEAQSGEANTMANRMELSANLNEQDSKDEKGNIAQLISNSENIKSLKIKLEEHYAKADAISKEHFDTLNRSLEHVMLRNNAFLVHTITEIEGVRHNANSNVSAEATIEDDIDILLSLEPSVSASSIVSGNRSSLWANGNRGFLIGGGQIGEAGHGDLGTHGDRIKKRTSAAGENASIEKIDEVIGRDKGTHTGMNEVVINNPEVFGFFQQAGKDENGRFWVGSVEETRHISEKLPNFYGSGIDHPGNKNRLKKKSEQYRKNFSIATERGIPLYVMTENREVYECLNVNDDGTIEVGKQLTPEEVVTGRAGLPLERRKEIGEKLLEKKIFKKQETQEEAREIINEL